MAVKQRNIHKDWRLIGVFASAAAYLTDRNKSSATKGDSFYNTTLNRLETYDGSSWSPAGMSGIGSGSLDAAANIGTKITIDSAFSTGVEIEADNGQISSDGALLLLDNNDTGSDVHCLELTNEGTAAALQFTAGQAGDDVQGTSDTWAITSVGVIDGSGLILKSDNDNITLGTGGDVTISYNDGTVGTAGTGIMFQGTGAPEQVQFGDGSYEFDVLFIGDSGTGNFMHFDGDGGADSVGALIFDNTDIDLGDLDLIRFGDGPDFTLGNTSGSPNILKLLGDDQQFDIGAAGAGMDVYWYTETSGNHVYFDEDNELVDFVDVDLRLDDDSILHFGSGPDFTVQNIAGSPNVLRITGDDQQLDFGVSGGGFDMYWYTEDAGNYILWDEDNSRMDLIDVDLRLDDDARLYFGSDADAYAVWDDANGEVDFVGNLNITGTLTVSGSFDIGNFAFGDDEELRFGNSNDFVFQYDSVTSNMAIDAASANDAIDVGLTVDTDWIFHGNTGGSDAHWDASEDTLCLLDNAVLGFGNTAATPDVEISWDTSRLNITGSGEEIRIGADTAPMDVRFYGTTTGDYMLWDGTANTNGGLVFEDTTVTMMDNTNLLFGDGVSGVAGDFKVYSDGTSLFIKEVATATGLAFNLGISGKGLDVQFYGENAGKDMLWDQSEDALTLEDTAYIKLGTGNDLIMSATGTTTLFKILAGSVLNIEDTDNIASKITFGITTGTNGLDILFNSATAGDNITFDAQNKTLTFTDCTTVFGYDDNTVAYTTAVDSSDYLTLSATDTNAARLVLGTASGTNSMDVWFLTPTAGEDIIFDAGGKTLTFDNVDILLSDNDLISFGDAGADGSIASDGTNVDCTIATLMTFGDGGTTNYMTVKSDGEINLAGTAKVTKNLQLPIAIGGGSTTLSLITESISIDFNADTETVFVTWQVPNDWDAGSDLYIKMMFQNEIAETDGDDIEIIFTVHGVADGETNSALGQATTGALNLTGGDEGQDKANLVSATINYDDGSYPIAAGDTVAMKGIISLGAGTECTGPLHIIDWWIEYTADKLGTAT